MSDWIKMRTGLFTNPKVIRMSRFLAGDRHFIDWWTRGTTKEVDRSVYELCDVTVVTRVTVGSLLSVWGSANECANSDGRVTGISLFEVDEMAGIPSFGNAMLAVGWIVEEAGGIRFPNFQEHNTVGKERSSGAKTGAERTKEYRDRKRATGDVSRDVTKTVTVTSLGDHREEKRREENKRTLLTQADLVTEGVSESAARDWLAVRKSAKAPLTETAWNAVKTEAVKANLTAAEAVKIAAERGWRSFKADWLKDKNGAASGNSEMQDLFRRSL